LLPCLGHPASPFEFVSYQKDATIRYKAFDQVACHRAAEIEP
jgi:hypothetical protein